MKTTFLISNLGLCLLLANCATDIPLVVEHAEQAKLPTKNLPPQNRSSTVSLASLASRVTSNHPQIRAAHLRLEEAKGQIIQSGRLSNPELGIDLSKDHDFNTEGGLQVSFAQRFPITNRLSLEKRISRQQFQIAQQEIKITQHQLAAEAQLIAVDILINRKKITQLSQQIKSLNTLSSFIGEAAKRGELSPLDENQAKIEASTLTSEQTRLKSEVAINLGKLKPYLGLPSSAPLKLTGTLPSPSIPSSRLTLSNSPIYQAKSLEIQQAEQAIALEKSKRYDDIEVSGFAELAREEDAPEGLETERTIGIGVKIPLQLYNKNEGNIKTSRAKASRLLLEKNALATQLKQNAETQLAEMKSWLTQTNNITNQLVPLAESNSKQFEETYRNGQSPFTSLLSARNQELKVQSQKIETLAAFHKARVKYFAAISKPTAAY